MALGPSYRPNARTDFAAGGVQSGYTNIVAASDACFRAPTGFLAQVGRFGAQGVTVGPNDIAGVWIGSNDIGASGLPSGTVGGVTVNQPLGTRPSVPVLAKYVVGNIRSGIQRLASDGFRTIVLLSPYDLAQSSDAAVDPTTAALDHQYSVAVRALESTLHMPGVKTYFLDMVSLLQQVQAHPGAYGFTHTTSAANCQASNCADLTLAEQNTFIFYNGSYFTNAFHRITADHVAAIVNAGVTVPAPVPGPARKPL